MREVVFSLQQPSSWTNCSCWSTHGLSWRMSYEVLWRNCVTSLWVTESVGSKRWKPVTSNGPWGKNLLIDLIALQIGAKSPKRFGLSSLAAFRPIEHRFGFRCFSLVCVFETEVERILESISSADSAVASGLALSLGDDFEIPSFWFCPLGFAFPRSLLWNGMELRSDNEPGIFRGPWLTMVDGWWVSMGYATLF